MKFTVNMSLQFNLTVIALKLLLKDLGSVYWNTLPRNVSKRYA